MPVDTGAPVRVYTSPTQHADDELEQHSRIVGYARDGIHEYACARPVKHTQRLVEYAQRHLDVAQDECDAIGRRCALAPGFVFAWPGPIVLREVELVGGDRHRVQESPGRLAQPLFAVELRQRRRRVIVERRACAPGTHGQAFVKPHDHGLRVCWVDAQHRFRRTRQSA